MRYSRRSRGSRRGNRRRGSKRLSSYHRARGGIRL